jgi:hypothetical protein
VIVLEYILLAEMTLVTGIVTGGAIALIAAVKKIKGTVGPIVGLVNMVGGRKD